MLLSEEDLQTAEKRRDMKDKEERERYAELNAEFERIARRDKKDFLDEQVFKMWRFERDMMFWYLIWLVENFKICPKKFGCINITSQLYILWNLTTNQGFVMKI